MISHAQKHGVRHLDQVSSYSRTKLLLDVGHYFLQIDDLVHSLQTVVVVQEKCEDNYLVSLYHMALSLGIRNNLGDHNKKSKFDIYICLTH